MDGGHGGNWRCNRRCDPLLWRRRHTSQKEDEDESSAREHEQRGTYTAASLFVAVRAVLALRSVHV